MLRAAIERQDGYFRRMNHTYLFSGVEVTAVRSNWLRAPQDLSACDWVPSFTIGSTGSADGPLHTVPGRRQCQIAMHSLCFLTTRHAAGARESHTETLGSS